MSPEQTGPRELKPFGFKSGPKATQTARRDPDRKDFRPKTDEERLIEADLATDPEYITTEQVVEVDPKAQSVKYPTGSHPSTQSQ